MSVLTLCFIQNSNLFSDNSQQNINNLNSRYKSIEKKEDLNGKKVRNAEAVSPIIEPEVDRGSDHPLIQILQKLSISAPEIRVPSHSLEVAEFETEIEKANNRHSFTLASEWSTQQDRSPSNVDRLTEGRAGLQFQKNLWDPPSKLRLDSSRWNEEELKANLEGQRQAYFERICRLYLNLFRMQNTLELAKLNRGVNFDNYIATSDRYQEGELTLTDKELSSTRFNVSKAVLVDAEYQQEITRREFSKLTSMSYPEELILFDIDSNHEVMKEIVSGNTEIVYYGEVAAKAAVNSQRSIYEASKYNQWPTLSLDAESAYLEETGSLASRVDWEHRVGVSFDIPLYRGGFFKNNRYQERSRLKVLENQFEIITKEKEFEVARMISTLRYHENLKKYYSIAEKSADNMVLGFREEYLVGTRTSTDLLDAENERFTVKIRRLNSELDLTLTKLSVLRVFGQLNIENLSTLMKSIVEEKKKKEK